VTNYLVEKKPSKVCRMNKKVGEKVMMEKEIHSQRV